MLGVVEMSRGAVRYARDWEHTLFCFFPYTSLLEVRTRHARLGNFRTTILVLWYQQSYFGILCAVL